MTLPNKLVVDLVQLSGDIDKLAKILKKYLKFSKCLEVTDVGNDIEYSLKEIILFKKKLKDLVAEESSKYETDIFGYQINSFRYYRYVEMLFSSDFKKITSARLYGKRKNRRIRYVAFNMVNPYDYNIINLIYNMRDIIDNFENLAVNETEYIQFLNEYFLPVPSIYVKKQKDIKCLDNISKKYDIGIPKTNDDFIRESQKMQAIEFKKSIYDIRSISIQSVSSIDFLLGGGKIEEILNKMEELIDIDPLKVINLIYEEILNKFNIADLITFAQEQALSQVNINPSQLIANLPLIDIFEKIDSLPPIISKQIYKDFKSPDLGLQFSFQDIFRELETYSNNLLSDKKPACAGTITPTKYRKNIKLKDLFNDIKLDFPDLYPQIEAKFNELFPREIIVQILSKYIDLKFFSLKIPKIDIPKINLPTLEITDLFGDFSQQFDDLVLKIISISLTEITKGIMELLLKAGQLDDFIFENILTAPTPPGINVPKFENTFNEDWLIYIDYAFKLLSDTNALQIDSRQISQEISSNLNKEENIEKLKNKKNEISKIDLCQPKIKNNISIKLNKKNKKTFEKLTLKQTAQNGDLDSMLEKIKYYNYSKQHDYFTTRNIAEEEVVDILTLIANGLDDEVEPKNNKPLPKSAIDIAKSLSDMIEQIETVLTPKELSLLLRGKYTNTTAEIIRTICKINFPTIADRVDPIKYFTMLGKVVGNVTPPGVKR